jgi:hypothetical protein
MIKNANVNQKLLSTFESKTINQSFLVRKDSDLILVYSKDSFVLLTKFPPSSTFSTTFGLRELISDEK